MKRNKQKITEKGLIKYRKIARISAKLFHDKGYLETSLGDIADATKISKGGLYYYFSSKQETLHCILKNYMDGYLENLKSTLDSIDDNSSKLRYIVSHHIKYYNDNLYESKILVDEVHRLPPKERNAITEKEIAFFRDVVTILSNLSDRHIEPERLKVAAFCLFGMCNWLYHWYNPRGPVSPSELSEMIYNIFTEGFLRGGR